MEKEGEVAPVCFQPNTAMHGPIHTKLSELSLLDDSVSNQQEKPTYALHTISSAHTMLEPEHNLKEPSSVCKPSEKHGNFRYQVPPML